MSNHRALSLFTALNASRGSVWSARGYSLDAENGAFVIKGDLGQFYLDAVARDADAHLPLEFLRQHNSFTWHEVKEMAEDDGIDLEESQAVFLMGQSLDVHVGRL